MSFFPLPLNHLWKTGNFPIHLILTAKTHFMRKFRLLSLLLLSTLFITVSCTKEGPEGPAGISGIQGPAGIQGPVGPAGPQGPVGVTNVTYSSWYTTVTGDWVTTNAALYTGVFVFNKPAPALTQAIIDNGLVLCYAKNFPIAAGSGRSLDVVQLPYWADFDFVDYWDYVLTGVGNIRFIYKSFDPWNNATVTGTQYRYVIIPGSIAGGRGTEAVTNSFGGYTESQLKAMPYNEVAKLFNIPAEGSNTN